MRLNTQYAPAARASREVIEAQQAIFQKKSDDNRVSEGSGEYIAVLNSQRQVVYANASLLELFYSCGATDIYGLRLGELIRCIHAGESEGGCGTSADCRYCDVLQVILQTTQEGKALVEECTVVSSLPAGEASGNYRVRTIPLNLGGYDFVLLSFQDIRHQKRKNALERIFFHDILNTVSSLKVNLELLKRSPGAPLPLVKNLAAIADSLNEEIQSQKMLVYAENGTLQVTRDLISSRGLLENIIERFRHDPLAEGKELELLPFCEDSTFISDNAILLRVLVNAVKNALEASSRGSRISLHCRREEKGVLFKVGNPGVIPPEVKARLFYRYFSTKGSDRGLGTYSMKLLTEDYLGGLVMVESRRELGTVFSIIIPLEPVKAGLK